MAVTITEETYGNLQKVTFAFTSAADGTASGTSTAAFDGILERAIFAPATGGDQPTDAFDVVVNDEDGYDVLMGAGANLSNAAPTLKTAANLGAVKRDKLAIAVSNAGNVKKGTVILYVRRV